MERARDHIQIIVDGFVMRGFRLRAIATAVTAALRWGGLVEKKKPFNHLSRSYKNDLRSLVRGESKAVKLSRLGGIEGVAANLNTDLRMGIGSATSMQMSDRDKQLVLQEAELNKQLAERKYVFGVNTHTLNCIQESKRVLIWQTFKRNCRLAIIQNVYILCGVLLLALSITNRDLDLSIGLVTLMVTIIKAGTKMGIDFCLSNCLQNLALQRAENRMKARVIRCGRRFHVSTCEIVVGDLVELCCGDRVPADGLAVESNSLPGVNYMEGTNQTSCLDSAFLTSGSIMQSKSGRLMLVTAVGKDTQWTGHSSLSTGSDTSSCETTRTVDHDFFTQFRNSEDVLERLMLYVTLLLLIVLSLSYFTHLRVADLDSSKADDDATAVIRDFYGLQIRVVDLDSRNAHDIATSVIHYLVYDFYDKLAFLLTLAPFNLFSTVSLALFYFIPRVSVDGACIMKIQRCYTKLGSITTICTGKAGLLTAAKMEVKSSWIAGDLREHEDHETLLLSAMPEEIGSLLLEALVLNSDSRSASSTEESSCGNRTEKALLRWAHQEGMDIEAIRQRYTVLKVAPFDSDRKQSGAFVQRREGGDGNCIVHWKGAAEIILSFCNRLVCRDAESSGINMRTLLDDDRSDIEAKIANMEHNGLRCVAFAYKMAGRAQTASGSMQLLAHISLEKRDLILLAVVGMKETLMSGVTENVTKARNAGLRVIMVTGDSVEAARAMAKECGIIQESNNIDSHDQIVDGSTFRAWSLRNRQQRVQRLTVLARASVHDKQLLVASLQANDEVVAVTGHKHRDVDVLQMADVGFSLGSSGERVAMENSDIILQLAEYDDALASLLKAVKWGRCVRCNLQYFIQFELSMAAVTPLISQLSGMQFQWIDLITVLATVAVIMQPPLPSLMLQPPIPQNLYTNVMVRNLVLQVIYQVILFVVIILLDDDGYERQRTIVFNSFIFCQLMNIVNARQRHIFESLLLHTDDSSQGLLKKVKSFLRECRTSILENNLLSLAVITVIAIVQYVLIQFGGSKISSIPLGRHDWLFCLSLAGGSWVVAVLGEFLPMPNTPHFFDPNFFV